jgi:hypothetical protein
MKRKLFAIAIIFSLSCASHAASPFLVKNTDVGGSGETVEMTNSKEVTLAESLVELQNGEPVEHHDNDSNNTDTEIEIDNHNEESSSGFKPF